MDIATSCSALPITPAPDTYDFAPLVFTGIFGLAFSCFTSLPALYPATERLQNIRSKANKDALGLGFHSISKTALDEVVVRVVRAERDAQGDS